MGIWHFERRAGHSKVARSTPGHLLHCLFKGSTLLTANERTYRICPGAVIYYHEQEEVRNHYLEDTFFYSIAFNAPELPPLALARRVFPIDDDVVAAFARLHEIYLVNSSGATLQLFQLLLKLLSRLGFNDSTMLSYSPHEKLWRQIEVWIRKKREFRVGVKDLCKQFNISGATLHRVCRDATENSVAGRIRQIRMEEAKSLLIFSGLNVTEIAQYLGYPRVHEFSREFSAYFKQTASSFKRP